MVLATRRQSLGAALPHRGGGHHPHQASSLIGQGGCGELGGGFRKPQSRSWKCNIESSTNAAAALPVIELSGRQQLSLAAGMYRKCLQYGNQQTYGHRGRRLQHQQLPQAFRECSHSRPATHQGLTQLCLSASTGRAPHLTSKLLGWGSPEQSPPSSHSKATAPNDPAAPWSPAS